MNFANLVENMFGSFTTVIGSMAGGLKDAFMEIIYVDPAVENPEFSPLVIFLFVAGGIALGMGLLTGIFGLVRGVTHH